MEDKDKAEQLLRDAQDDERTAQDYADYDERWADYLRRRAAHRRRLAEVYQQPQTQRN